MSVAPACHTKFSPGSFQGMLSVELPFERKLKVLRSNRFVIGISAVLPLAVALAILHYLVTRLVAKAPSVFRKGQALRPANQTATLLSPCEEVED